MRRFRKWSPGWWLTAGGTPGGSLAAVQVGPIASRPSSGGATNIVYQSTDSPYQFFWNGTTWLTFAFGYQVTPPVLANFTQVNVDKSTFDTTHGGIVQTITTAGSAEDCQVLNQAIPASGTYFVDCACTYTAPIGNGGFGVGIMAGQLVTSALEFSMTPWSEAGIFKTEQRSYNSCTSLNAVNIANTSWLFSGPMIWFRVVDDRTNLSYYLSANGTNWQAFYSHARGSFLTPADCGLVVVPFNLNTIIHWLHYSVHT